MTIRHTSEQWSKLIALFQQSGQTQAAFCREHNIGISTLQYQLRKQKGYSPRSPASSVTSGKSAHAEENPAPASPPRLVELQLPKSPSDPVLSPVNSGLLPAIQPQRAPEQPQNQSTVELAASLPAIGAISLTCEINRLPQLLHILASHNEPNTAPNSPLS